MQALGFEEDFFRGFDHRLAEIESEDVGHAAFYKQPAEPAFATAAIQHAQSGHIAARREHGRIE